MKVLNKIKSIYLLAIVAIVSFCMLLFPAMPKTARADGTLGTGDGCVITIKSSNVQATTYEEDGNTYSKWAIYFTAEITQTAYEAIFGVVDGVPTASGKIGVLIGQTSRMDGIETKTVENIVADKDAGGLSFQAISYIGVGMSDGSQELVFAKNAKTLEFNAGIVYDEKEIPTGREGVEIAIRDLTAIPFYMNTSDITEEGADVNILFDQAKSMTPRDRLVHEIANTDTKIEQKTSELDAATAELEGIENTEENQAQIEAATQKVATLTEEVGALNDAATRFGRAASEYAGTISIFEGDAYICRSTNRLMVEGTSAVEGAKGTLAPQDNMNLVYNAKPVSSEGALIDSNFVSKLPAYGEGIVINYVKNAQDTFNDTVVIYKAKVAERVITRFSDRALADSSVTNTTEDYLAVAGTDSYTSIFAVKLGAENIYGVSAYDKETKETTFNTATGVYSTSVAYLSMGNDEGKKSCFDGLYVLADHIDIDGEYIVNTGVTLASKMSIASGGNAKTAISVPIYGLGFKGTFDGRGFTVDANGNANQGIFPSAFGATVKNTAFNNLSQTIDGGGIMSHARASRFENIYAKVTNVTNGKGDLNKGILMNVEDCQFKNFVAMVDVANTAMANAKTGTVSAGAGNEDLGQGQGVNMGGVFSFRAYTDMYFDPTLNNGEGGARYLVMSAALGPAFSDSMKEILTEEEITNNFGNLLHSDGRAFISYAIGNPGTIYTANPAPLGNYQNALQIYRAKYNSAFVGTTGENVYAIGSSPLYLAHYYAEATTAVSLNASSTSVHKKTTLFVNEAPDLADGSGKADIAGWRYENGVYTEPTAYKMNQIAGDMFTFDANDGKYSLGEIILYGKAYRYAASKLKTMLGGTANSITNALTKSPETKLEVEFVHQDGFYDVATEADMADYVNKQETPFDAAFWNVVDGVVSWKNLYTKAN